MIADEDRRKFLEYEDFVAEVTRRRNPPPRNVWWESTALITSATAVLTVALTATAGYFAQRALRASDVATQEAQTTYQQEVAVLQSAHLLATESLHYAAERARLEAGSYNALQREQRNRLVDSVNASDYKWRQGRQTNKVGLELEFGDDRPVLLAWVRCAGFRGHHL